MQSLTFDDFDAFAESVRGVESRMLQRNVKQCLWKHDSVDVDGVGLQLGKLGSGNIAEGQLHSNGCMLYLPLTESLEYTANGQALEKDAIAILEPGSEFCVSTKQEHDWCGVAVPTHFFARGERSEPWPGPGAATVRVTRPDHQIANQLRDVAGQIMIAAASSPQFESSPAAAIAAGELIQLAALVVGQQRADLHDSGGRPRVSRQQIIARSKQFLDQRKSKVVFVREMAAAADVSERTLRTAFQEYFGVGPVRYLQLVQLHQVRRALRAADPAEVTLSNLLVQHGIWEFSRFASRYRRLFGVLPSETLRTN